MTNVVVTPGQTQTRCAEVHLRSVIIVIVPVCRCINDCKVLIYRYRVTSTGKYRVLLTFLEATVCADNNQWCTRVSVIIREVAAHYWHKLSAVSRALNLRADVSVIFCLSQPVAQLGFSFGWGTSSLSFLSFPSLDPPPSFCPLPILRSPPLSFPSALS